MQISCVLLRNIVLFTHSSHHNLCYSTLFLTLKVLHQTYCNFQRKLYVRYYFCFVNLTSSMLDKVYSTCVLCGTVCAWEYVAMYVLDSS